MGTLTTPITFYRRKGELIITIRLLNHRYVEGLQ